MVGFTYSACRIFTKLKKVYKNSKKQKALDISIRTNQTTPVFQNMVRKKVYQEEQSLIKYCAIRHQQLLIIQHMMNMNKGQSQWSTNFLAKILETLLLTQEQNLFLGISNSPMNCRNLSLQNLLDKKYTHLFEITFRVLILQVCN